MDYKHGVYGEHEKFAGKLGSEGATIPVYLDTAPVWQLNTAGAASFDYTPYIGKPVLVKGMKEVKRLLGYSEAFASFGLCEAAYVHFGLRGTGPILVVNLANPSKLETAEQSATVTVAGAAGAKVGYLKDALAAIEHITVTGVDEGKYTLEYAGDSVKITVTDETFSASSVTMAYHRVDVSQTTITVEEYQAAVNSLDYCDVQTGRHPNLLVSPRFSGVPAYHAILLAKAVEKLGSKWESALLSDIPSTAAVNTRALAKTWKATNNYGSNLDKVFWPCCKSGSVVLHASTVAAAVLEDQDAKAGDVPYMSIDNKDSGMDGICLESGVDVLLCERDANDLNEVGITTFNVLNSERRFWGCHMANYAFANEENIDPEYLQDTSIRMAIYLRNYRKENYADSVGNPMARRDIDAVLASVQQWLNGLVNAGKLLYAKVSFNETDNRNSSMATGDFVFSVADTFTPTAKSLTFIDHYTADGLAALTGGEG